MATQPGTLETLARQLGVALQPLEQKLQQGSVISFFDELGLHFPPQLLTPGFTGALSTGGSAAGALPGLITALATAIQNGEEGAIVSAGIQLIAKVGEVISALDKIGQQLGSIGPLPGMNPADVDAFAVNFVSRLLGYLVISYLEQIAPAAVGIGNLLGILDYIPTPASDAAHPAFTLRQLQLGNLGELLKSPADRLKKQFDWGLPGFTGDKLMPRLANSLTLLGAHATLKAPNEVDTALVTFIVDPAINPPGLTANLHYPIAAGIDLNLSISRVWSVHIQAQGTFDAGLSAILTAPANVALTPPTGTLQGRLETDLLAKGTDPLILIGQTRGSRLQMDAFSFGAGLGIRWETTKAVAEPLISVQIEGGKVIIDMANADGFIATVLGGIHVEAGFDLKAVWTPDTGLHIEGGAQLELNIPLNLTLGPITLPTLYLIAGASESGVPIEVSVALGLTLGPIQASVDRIGIKALLSFPDLASARGNLGPVGLDIAFKPPTGLGIAIDAGPITGGGFIEFDPDNGRYAGVLALSLYGISIKAIGLLDTKLPGGKSGFSFLIIITVEFSPIQLSFGFTLNGVGGLAGINRTMVTAAIQAGVRNHSIDHILFPKDPVRNAPQIISDLRTIYPPAEGRYVFGPMVAIGWGTPSLVEAELGIILEVPSPIVIAILGQLNMALPTKDAAAVELHLDVLGIIDFGKKLFSLDATLHDSRIVLFTIYGDMAMRLSWGDNPTFLFSIGGWNPHFQAPPNFPALRPLTLGLTYGDELRLTLQTYFGVTSNTFQLGANLEIFVGVSEFNLYGRLGFDALIIFSPFSFLVEFIAGIALRSGTSVLFAISLRGTLSGPTPWHVEGDAHFSILFFDASVHVSVTWGESQTNPLPSVNAWDPLSKALGEPGNWSGALPSGELQVVTIAAPEGKAAPVLLEPSGTLTFREKVLPLNQKLTKFGEAVPDQQDEFDLKEVILGGQPSAFTLVTDNFARGQFQKLSDAEKLTLPSFEMMPSGFAIGGSLVAFGKSYSVDVEFDTVIVDSPTATRRGALYPLTQQRLAAQSLAGAAAASALRTTGLATYAPDPRAPVLAALNDEQYVVARTDELVQRHDVTPPVTKGQAYDALAKHLSSNPGDRGTLQVIPVHELAEAA
jgi:hypothetical protein